MTNETTNEKYRTEEGEPTTVVQVDKCYLIIGVEVNVEEAYRVEKIMFSRKVARHQILEGVNSDFGHGFFYVVKNNKVDSFFSFGPTGHKDKGNIIGRSSTCQYPISEVTQLFYLEIEKEKAEKIKKDVKKIFDNSNNEIYDKKLKVWVEQKSNVKKYRVTTNETCAKEAENILKKHLKDKVPSGMGYIKYNKISMKAINPYAWHESLVKSKLKKYTYPEYPQVGKAAELLAAYNKKKANDETEKIYTYYLRSEGSNEIFTQKWKVQMDPVFNKEDNDDNWWLYEGVDDPLQKYGYI